MTGQFFAFLFMTGISLLPWAIMYLIVVKAREIGRRK